MNLLEIWAVSALTVWATAALLPGIQLHGAVNALVVAAVFGVLNACIGWLLFSIIGIGTLGIGFLLAFLTRWVVMAVLLLVTARMTSRIRVASFGWAFVGAMVMSVIGSLAERLLSGPGMYRF